MVIDRGTFKKPNYDFRLFYLHTQIRMVLSNRGTVFVYGVYSKKAKVPK